jgi:hypothetical protein
MVFKISFLFWETPYRELKNKNYYRLRSALLSSNTIEWFFLSGGRGVIHALEAARKYQATFNRNIAYQKRYLTLQNYGITCSPHF